MQSRSFVVALGLIASSVLGSSAGALQGARFTEEAAARGLVYTTFAGNGIAGSGCGVAWSDLDRDGDDDVVLTGKPDDQPGVFENDGTGHFIDR